LGRFYCHRGFVTKLFSFSKDRIYFKICEGCEKKLDSESCAHCDSKGWIVGLSGKMTVNDGTGRTFQCIFGATHVKQMTGWGENELLDALDQDPLLENLFLKFQAQEFLFYITAKQGGSTLEFVSPIPPGGTMGDGDSSVE
jgi:hypothetical protein